MVPRVIPLLLGDGSRGSRGRIHYTAVVAAAAVYHVYIYCWNLIAGDKSIDRLVGVRLGPSVKVSQADLGLQLSYTLKLRDMQNATVVAAPTPAWSAAA